MMNAQKKADWVAALRGGNYKQGTNRLKKQDGTFCCLGVLCDLYDPNRWEAEDDSDYPCYSFDGYAGTLPNFVKVDAGIPPGATMTLASMNDQGLSFGEIADWIEEHL
jgi:hypothetical protein